MSFMRLFVSFLIIVFVQMPFVAAPSVAQVTGIDSHSAAAAIIRAGVRAGEIADIADVPSVGVIDLSIRATPHRYSDPPDVSEFRVSAAKNASGIIALRRALRRNPATRQALSQHGVSIDRVVGVDIGSSGSLRVYVL
jgi:GrpB-like predicted nucleotidyltransferase (UPF0157 family)